MQKTKTQNDLIGKNSEAIWIEGLKLLLPDKDIKVINRHGLSGGDNSKDKNNFEEWRKILLF